jgi:hypothetical protein
MSMLKLSLLIEFIDIWVIHWIIWLDATLIKFLNIYRYNKKSSNHADKSLLQLL